jgi:LuxR family maltose regulon positive regulatory protein
LDRWLRLLPDELIQQSPWLLLIKAIVFGFSWQLAAMWKLLGPVEALLDEGAERIRRPIDVHDLPALRGIIATLRGQEAYHRGQADRAIACSEAALALLPRKWSYVRGIAVLYWGLSMQAAGRGDAAQRALIDEYGDLFEKTDAYALRLLFTACFNAIERGHLEQARLMAQAMLDHATSSRLQHVVGYAHYMLGVVHYCWNELDTARQHFEILVVKRFAVHTQAARNGMIGMVRVHIARAEVAPAWSAMELLRQFDLDRLGQGSDDARSLAAQLAYVQGDSEAAFRWADTYDTPVMGRSLLWLQDPHLAKARILLARGTGADLRSALDILDVLREFAQHTCNVRVQIEVLALYALALERQGKAADAVAALQQAVELARPGGFIRVFVDLGSPMRSMLLRLVGPGPAAETVRRILAAFLEPQETIASGNVDYRSRAANTGLVEPLTDREMEVLTLLRQRLSNKEIASQLVLSVATVKRYTVNINQKLGVNRRRDAVIEAEALGILPPR